MYLCSLVSSNNGQTQMLDVSVNMDLITPTIVRGEVKQFHVNVGIERLTGADAGIYSPVDVMIHLFVCVCVFWV